MDNGLGLGLVRNRADAAGAAGLLLLNGGQLDSAQ